ncbi:MAG: 50S ribosomal protein L9 [Lachnospiraceae bacterium]|nr:50S ribosomal protein L9 [Lachnospiraceae bacterium]
MKVILLQDVKSIGKKGQIIDTSDGYAKNFLIPRELGIEATKSNLNDLMLKEKAEEKRTADEYKEALLLAGKLKEKTINLSVKAGENGKIFGSVTNKEIAAALLEQAGISIDKKKIILPETIKTIGTKEVDVKIHSKVDAKITVNITEA